MEKIALNVNEYSNTTKAFILIQNLIRNLTDENNRYILKLSSNLENRFDNDYLRENAQQCDSIIELNKKIIDVLKSILSCIIDYKNEGLELLDFDYDIFKQFNPLFLLSKDEFLNVAKRFISKAKDAESEKELYEIKHEVLNSTEHVIVASIMEPLINFYVSHCNFFELPKGKIGWHRFSSLGNLAGGSNGINLPILKGGCTVKLNDGRTIKIEDNIQIIEEYNSELSQKIDGYFDRYFNYYSFGLPNKELIDKYSKYLRIMLNSFNIELEKLGFNKQLARQKAADGALGQAIINPKSSNEEILTLTLKARKVQNRID